MGLFGTNYNKEGKGVSKDEREKRRIFAFFDEYGRKFGALIKANILYFLTILPTIAGVILTGSEYKVAGIVLLIIGLFTFGPLTSAFTYIIRNYVMQSHVFLFSDFKEQFKINYKISLPLGIIDIIFPMVLIIAFKYYLNIGGMVAVIAGGIVLFAAVIFLIINFYAYPMIVTFNLKLRHILKNALLFAIVKFPVNLFILIIDGAIIYYFAMQFLSFNILGFIISLVGFSLFALSFVAFVTVFTVWKYIEDAMIEEDEEEESVFKDSI